jgi:hypothetical protein
MATLDMSGVGIEMEAGKPGWNDSLNGLPGLFGSSLVETLEVRRLVGALTDWLDAAAVHELDLPEEVAEFARDLAPLVAANAGDDLAPLDYWADANALKERYREQVRLGVAGRDVTVPVGEIRSLLANAATVLDAICRGDRVPVTRGAIPFTYYRTQVVRWEVVAGSVVPVEVETRPLPVSLEAPAHWIRAFPGKAREVYDAVRSSALFDTELQMYRLCEPYPAEDFAVGRAVGAYPRGWLENESIYTHMEYKWLLEVLRAGLTDEFWSDARTMFPAFLDPATYGRSPLEGVSFIVSGAHPDPAEHGRGYQPRLSGMTAEFLSMWMIASVGEHPFDLSGGGLRFAVRPRLPEWLFSGGWGSWPPEEATSSLAFAGLNGTCFRLHRIDPAVVPGGRPGVVAYSLRYRSGEIVEITGDSVVGKAAHDLRAGRVAAVDVALVTARNPDQTS